MTAYASRSERYSVRDLASGLLCTDPVTGAAILPPRARTLGDAFTAALLPRDDATRQRVPIVTTDRPASYGPKRFVCDCGARVAVLYRPPDAERFTCRRCARISYETPPSRDAALKRHVRELVAAHGLDAVTAMAKRGLEARMARLRAPAIPDGGKTGETAS